MILKVILIIIITLILCVGMILGCAFLSGKSKKFIDRLSGNIKNNK